jgi:hypothetical protein
MRIVFLALLLNSGLAFAAGYTVNAQVGSTIPTAYSTSSTESRVGECIGNKVTVINQTDSVLAVGFGTASSVPSTDFDFVPAGPGAGTILVPKHGLSAGQYIYFRSAGTAAEDSGRVYVGCKLEE